MSIKNKWSVGIKAILAVDLCWYLHPQMLGGGREIANLERTKLDRSIPTIGGVVELLAYNGSCYTVESIIANCAPVVEITYF